MRFKTEGAKCLWLTLDDNSYAVRVLGDGSA